MYTITILHKYHSFSACHGDGKEEIARIRGSGSRNPYAYFACPALTHVIWNFSLEPACKSNYQNLKAQDSQRTAKADILPQFSFPFSIIDSFHRS